MTPPRNRLLASQLFWGAIFVAAFILWAWVDSIYHYTGILACGRQNGVGFWQNPGTVRLAFLHGASLSAKPDIGYVRSKRAAPGKAFSSFGLNYTGGVRPSANLYLPYWGILGGHVLFMTCLIAWRCRRREVIVDPRPAK
jgi:hypothetical protein